MKRALFVSSLEIFSQSNILAIIALILRVKVVRLTYFAKVSSVYFLLQAATLFYNCEIFCELFIQVCKNNAVMA